MSRQASQDAEEEHHVREKGDSIPVAPYPPSDYPPFSAGPEKQLLRSSMSSSPHYSSRRGSSPLDQHSAHAAVSLPSSEVKVTRDRSKSLGEQLERRAASGGPAGNRLVCPPRAQFCPDRSDLYGCINCLELSPADVPLVATAEQTASSEDSGQKQLGPVLMELRQLSMAKDETTRRNGSFFNSSPVGVSRGKPHLGSSVASTCLSFRPSSSVSKEEVTFSPMCATGLTTGALCVHTWKSNQDDWECSQTFFTPRHQRISSAVAWRPSNNQHVAVGLVASAGLGIRRGGSGSRGGSGDREFSCLVWDVESQAHSSVKGKPLLPMSRLSHNAGVASLAWLQGGQTLAVGCQMRMIQLYDMRASGFSQPLSAWAHTEGVNGIEMDPHRPGIFATFSRSVGEPVKLWDIKKMDSCLAEIKTTGIGPDSEASYEAADGVLPGMAALFGTGNMGSSVVTCVRWSSLRSGTLSVAMGDAIRRYDTSGSRPSLTAINDSVGHVADLCLRQTSKVENITRLAPEKEILEGSNVTTTVDGSLSGPALLQSHRILITAADGSIKDTPESPLAPLAISNRDGRVVHALGRTLFIGSTKDGPSAMENLRPPADEDVSATMMRRARCLNSVRYSIDAVSNVKMLSQEHEFDIDDHTATLHLQSEKLMRLWSWIGRAESLCLDSGESNEESPWYAKSLVEAGVWQTLKMESPDSGEILQLQSEIFSESLSCNTYDSPLRRAALTSCGWSGRFTLAEVMADCESLREYERSAALAVWHGDISAAVEALQRAADFFSSDSHTTDDYESSSLPPRYVEILLLVSMCIAGYSGSDPESRFSATWRKSCRTLLQRDELNEENNMRSGVAYLRAMCTFLINLGVADLDKVLYDNHLSLSDRVAFACRFLERRALKSFLADCMDKCKKSGDVEGLAITGVEKHGIAVMQSYVDATGDVQTASLVCGRVILPVDWSLERSICEEWLGSYRDMLNTWQMWQSRATFDVDRADHLRMLKACQGDDLQGTNIRGGYYQGRGRGQPAWKKQTFAAQSSKRAEFLLPSIPASMEARCNFCSTPLSGVMRRDGIANPWLNKMKPILPCCPGCRKPLPRCSICLLPFGCLNPYTELKRAGSRTSRGVAALQSGDDLSSLANLPFAEWFTWCMKCKHGGHAHHLIGWFAKHDVCPVSGCDCQCQFDGIEVLRRSLS